MTTYDQAIMQLSKLLQASYRFVSQQQFKGILEESKVIRTQLWPSSAMNRWQGSVNHSKNSPKEYIEVN